jgi:hypothetical protein
MAIGSTGVPGQTREQLRNQLKTTMFGRLAGMDVRNYEVGEEDTRLPVQNVSTTVPTSCLPNGFTNFTCTAASSAIHTFQDAVAGIYKTLTQLSSSTLGIAIQFGAAANIVTSAGSSFNQIVFAGVGHSVGLACVSTAGGSGNGPVWIATSPPSPGLTFSTF